jgi:hypothetical protein
MRLLSATAHITEEEILAYMVRAPKLLFRTRWPFAHTYIGAIVNRSFPTLGIYVGRLDECQLGRDAVLLTDVCAMGRFFAVQNQKSYLPDIKSESSPSD